MISEQALMIVLQETTNNWHDALDRIEKLEMAARGVPIRDMAALSKALKRIEKLEKTLRDVMETLDSDSNEIPYMVRNRYAYGLAKEAVENKDER